MTAKDDEDRFKIEQFITPDKFIDLMMDIKRVVMFVNEVDAKDIKRVLELAEAHEIELRGNPKDQSQPGIQFRLHQVEQAISIISKFGWTIAGLLLAEAIAIGWFLLTHGGAIFTFTQR